MSSNFHAVFSDHKLGIQKHRGKNPDCNWHTTPTTSTVFGSDSHPELTKLQCEQGALHSYREAQNNLEKLNCQRPSVNHHVQIQHITNRVGEHSSQGHQNLPSSQELPVAARELIVQVDGGHIPTKEQDTRIFEALFGIVLSPKLSCGAR